MIYLATRNKYFLSLYLLFSHFNKRSAKAYLKKLDSDSYRVYTTIGSYPVERIGFCAWRLYVWPGGNPKKKEVGSTLLVFLRDQLKRGWL